MNTITEQTRQQIAAVVGPPLFVPPEVAAYKLGVGRTRLYELIASGALRSYKDGRRRLIALEDIDDYGRRVMDRGAA